MTDSHDLSCFFEKLDTFLLSGKRNIWIEDNILSIYFRKGKHLINGQIIDFLDIASIDIIENMQRKGIFTSFIKQVIEKYPDKNLYVENILNDNVSKVLKRYNFKTKSHIYDLNMFLIKK